MSDKHVHKHDHQPSDISLRVKAVEFLLVEKGLLDPAAIDKLVDAYENKIGPHNGARVVAHAWQTQRTRSGSLRTVRPRSLSWASPVFRVRTWSWSKTPLKFTTWSFVHCVPATRGRLWACLLTGTKPLLTALVAVIDPRGVLKEFGVNIPESRKFGSGTAMPSCVISCCRSDLKGARDSTRLR